MYTVLNFTCVISILSKSYQAILQLTVPHDEEIGEVIKLVWDKTRTFPDLYYFTPNALNHYLPSPNFCQNGTYNSLILTLIVPIPCTKLKTD
jgi:hypothetical protein